MGDMFCIYKYTVYLSVNVMIFLVLSLSFPFPQPRPIILTSLHNFDVYHTNF